MLKNCSKQCGIDEKLKKLFVPSLRTSATGETENKWPRAYPKSQMLGAQKVKAIRQNGKQYLTFRDAENNNPNVISLGIDYTRK